MGWTGMITTQSVAVMLCTWLCLGGVGACSVDREPILSGQGGTSSAGEGGVGGDSGEGGVGGSGGTGGASGASGVGGTGGTGGTGGNAGTGGEPIDAGSDTGLPDASVDDAGDSGVPILPGSCAEFRPSGGACPTNICTGGCLDGTTCLIDCNGAGGFGCATTTINCPPGWVCQVRCTAINACAGATIVCADGPCSLTCTVLNACSTATLRCGADRCRTSCTAPMAASLLTYVPGTTCSEENMCSPF